MFPLFYECGSRDILLVLLKPLDRDDTPTTVEEIEQRIGEIAFSANFMREMRMFAQATAYSRPVFLSVGKLERRLQGARFHMIDSSRLPCLQRTDTKVLAHGPFLQLLMRQGRERVQAGIGEHGAAVGRRATLDVTRYFT